MKNRNKTKKDAKLIGKRALEALRFQTHWGLKQRYGLSEEHCFHGLADVEIDLIGKLNVTDELLEIRRLVEMVGRHFNVAPIPDCGELAYSIVALALGIAQTGQLGKMRSPFVMWEELVEKKLITIYFSDKYRNQIVCLAKENGYDTSTYLGQPVIKFNRLWVIIGRYKAEDNR